MSLTSKYSVINIRRYLKNDNPKIGEDRLLQVLSGFSCPKNPDLELFLKNSSIEFSKENGALLGYFTIALKALTIRGETVSKTMKRKLLRISELDEKSDTYTMAAYLIAQLGKNYAGGMEKKITGAELLELAWGIIERMQYLGGGLVVFLEANNEEKLLSFYNTNRFVQFDTRLTASDPENQHELIQLLRLL